MTLQGMNKTQYVAWAMEAYEITEREALSKWAHAEAQANSNIDEVEKRQLLLDSMYN